MTNLSGRSRENLQLSAAQEERISPSSAAQSGSSYEAQGGLSQASPQAHDQQRELHRKPPRGLSQRIMLALTVLLTGLAALYSAAMVGVIGYTEEELISSFLEDDMDYVVSQIERGDTAIGLPHADVYGDAPGLKPVPAQFQDCPFGFTEITEAPAVFVWRRAWQGGSLMIVRDQEGFEEKEQELFILMLAVLLVVFLVGAAAGKRLAVQVMRPVEKLAAAVRAASSQNTWKPLPKELITRDEVGNLAAELSASMHRLFKALKREKAFTGDVSHELRTPLTVIETSVELLKLTELTAAQQRQVDKIERSSKMMHELVEGFLAFARLSENAGSDRVSDVLQAVGRLWIPEAAKAGRQLVFRQEDCCPGSFSPNAVYTQLGHTAWSIFDESQVDYMIEKGVDSGVGVLVPVGAKLTKLKEEIKTALDEGSDSFFAASSVSAMAKKLGVPTKNLEAAVTAYNRGCAEGHDGEFFKDVKYMRPINTKKLYAIRLTSAFFTAFGGLNVNRDFEVLNTKNQPIKGLYATGLEVSRMIGHTYTTWTSGYAFGFSCYSGRHAALNAVEKMDL